MINFKFSLGQKSFIAMYLFLVCVLPISLSAATVTRQPGPFPIGMDTWYGSIYNTSAVHDSKIVVGANGSNIYNGQSRFDLGGLPTVADSVVLWSYHNSPYTPTSVQWYLNTEQWHSGSITWNTQPAGFHIGTTAAPETGWSGVDITSAYNAWRSGGAYPNFGLTLKPLSTDGKFNFYMSSGHPAGGARPVIQVSYTTSPTDSIPKFKWILASPSYVNRTVTHPFGADWAGGTYCNGLIKKHNGTDFVASAGTTIYAAEDGIVKEIRPASGWASSVTMEYTSPTGNKYTSVYWHINPNSDAYNSNSGGFIPKGAPIGVVANLGSNTHHHLGTRMAPYSYPDAASGASPQTNCGGYLAFPASFVDTNNINNIIFN